MSRYIGTQELFEWDIDKLIGLVIQFNYKGKVYHGEITDADAIYFYIDVFYNHGEIRKNRIFNHNWMEDIAILSFTDLSDAP